MFSDPKRFPLRPVLAIAFFASMLIVVPALPGAFAHGGMQPPAADFGGKKASLFLKLDPPVVTDASQPVFITARFFDENTNENFKEVTYRIFFMKDGKEIPISTEGGMYGGQGFFYDPNGNLLIKIVPEKTAGAVAKGEPEFQYGGVWNRGQPVEVRGPIFTEPGLYNLFVEIHTVGTTRTQVEPVLKYDVWVTPGREQTIDVPVNGQTQQVKVRNYYGAIDNSSYDEATKTIKFSMPFDWKSDMVSRIGMLHTEVFIPKAISEFDKESLSGTVNGIDTPVFVDNFGENETVVHFTISKQHLENLANQIRSEDRTPSQAVFTLSPPDPENMVNIMQLDADSSNYKVTLTIPEFIFPEQPIPFGVKITDKGGNPKSAATYEMVILDNQGNELSRSGGVTTPEGISSQDVTFNAQGSFTVRVEKINASGESVQSSIQVVPEFPVGIASMVAALGMMAVIFYLRRSKRA
jgi:hypothetical protein